MQEYRYIYEIYKEKSISKAAKNLYISQPSLSATVKKIEAKLGAKIFNRNSNLSLTEAGEIYIQAAKEIIRIEDTLKKNIEDYSSAQFGNIVVAGTAFFSAYILPPIVNTFHEHYPKISVEFSEADSVELYSKSSENSIDIIIDAGKVYNNMFTLCPLFRESILLAVPKTYSLDDSVKALSLSVADIIENRHLSSSTPGINLDLFKDDSFILLKKNHDLYERAISLCMERGFFPVSSIKINQLLTAYNLATQNMGITFISDTLIKCVHNSSDNLLFFKINTANTDLTQRNVFIAYKSNYYITKGMSLFIDIAKDMYKE